MQKNHFLLVEKLKLPKVPSSSCVCVCAPICACVGGWVYIYIYISGRLQFPSLFLGLFWLCVCVLWRAVCVYAAIRINAARLLQNVWTHSILQGHFWPPNKLYFNSLMDVLFILLKNFALIVIIQSKMRNLTCQLRLGLENWNISLTIFLQIEVKNCFAVRMEWVKWTLIIVFHLKHLFHTSKQSSIYFKLRPNKNFKFWQMSPKL